MIDYTNLVKETIDVSKFYEYAVVNDYNCAGHGYGDVYKLNKLKCVAKSDSVYVFTDGTAERSVERRFAEDLDNADEVVVYAKLPKGFYIPTPVGNYSPDWAIAFKEGTVKHVYFIAETKGSMSTLQLRGIEDAKIQCARKHFAALSSDNIKYDVVDSYKSLMEIVMK